VRLGSGGKTKEAMMRIQKMCINMQLYTSATSRRMMEGIPMKHLLKLLDLSKEEITELLDLADRLKAETKAGVEHHILKGKTLGMIFEKSSTRTRVSFETGM